MVGSSVLEQEPYKVVTILQFIFNGKEEADHECSSCILFKTAGGLNSAVLIV